MKITILLAVLLVLPALSPGQSSAPGEIEAGVLQELNLARTNPKSYIKKLKKFREHFEGRYLKIPGSVTIVTNEGVEAVDDAIEFLKDAAPLGEFQFSNGLAMAARDHVNDQGPLGEVGHTGSDGSGSDNRADRYGEWQFALAENISYGQADPERIVMQLIIDDGVPSRGHRKNIFNDELGKVGIAVGSHKAYGSMCVIVFAGDYLESGETSVPAKLVGAASTALASNPSKDYSFLSELEYEIVEEMNLARTDPDAYADLLRDFRKYYKGKYLKVPGEVTIVTVEGVDAVDEAIEYLEDVKPVPALGVSKGLTLGARDHVLDQGPKGALGHDGSDGSSSASRVSRYGEWQKTVGENIGYGEKTARRIVMQLIIDDGVASRGHRDNIFEKEFLVTGVAYGPHSTFGSMCVITYAGGFKDKP